MPVPQDIIVGVQILVTLGIIILPVVAQHPKNPYQKRTRSAINRLKRREDDLFDLVDFSRVTEKHDTVEENFADGLLQYYDIDIGKIESELMTNDKLDEVEVGFVQRGDYGFKTLLDAISQNRAIEKSVVSTIGIIYGPTDVIGSLEVNSEMPQGAKVLIGPNAGLFVDYGNNALPDRELIMYYPESPSLTLSLHELQMWTQETIRRKFHYATMVLAIVWSGFSLHTIV